MRIMVDAKPFDVLATSLGRNAKIKETRRSGEVRSGEHIREIVGTYFNYQLKIATDRMDPAAYDALYEILTEPVPSHMVTLPYGREGVLEFEAFVDDVDDGLLMDSATGRCWGGLTLTFKAKKPQRRPA